MIPTRRVFAVFGSLVWVIESRKPTEVMSYHSKATKKKAPFIIGPAHSTLRTTNYCCTWYQVYDKLVFNTPGIRSGRPSNVSSEKYVPRVPWHLELEWRLGYIRVCHGPAMVGRPGVGPARPGPLIVDIMGRGPDRPVKCSMFRGWAAARSSPSHFHFFLARPGP